MDLTPPVGLDLTESKRPELYGAYSVTYALALLAFGLRIVSRTLISKAGLWWDDYLVCMAMLTATANFATMIDWVNHGVGQHIYLYGIQGLHHFLLNLFIVEILYTLSICFTKYSILMFYWRIFGMSNIRYPIYLIAFVVTGWGLGVILTTIFQCLPVHGFWDKTIPSHCGVNVNNFFIGNAVPNILTDWALLTLPLPYVWKLQRSASQKLALTGVFIMGGFICIISIVRLIIMLNAYKVPSLDETWVFVGPSKWTAVETNIGIVSACLPSLRPVITLIKKTGSSTKGVSQDGSLQESYKCYSTLHSSGQRGKRGKRLGEDETALTLTAISVQTTLDVESSYSAVAR
ncbi:hypothetical protein CBS63078_11256 [Aspergillus niger]|uniref:DNA polymerase alpha/epsilon subunit B family protein n=1 Tax=Aspergillus niger TaxID=5061 RepID=A0A3F3RKC9_ASPNG|nr:hypothetical protein CBS63078_11256 [Aspergillus niger]KAI2999293.1 hypothetical protein CBS147345_9078 [Aspergillus niger]KAI3019578.1 hypothetical protein CBS147347_8959 [Aspergillus niger]KAI3042159.1 hypothetical protein CBS147352_9133 [Aspergillus niger]TPR05884.1 DNA polymerase alpha/epsilon subunit B family protein [Aspergillus niger]